MADTVDSTFGEWALCRIGDLSPKDKRALFKASVVIHRPPYPDRTYELPRSHDRNTWFATPVELDNGACRYLIWRRYNVQERDRYRATGVFVGDVRKVEDVAAIVSGEIVIDLSDAPGPPPGSSLRRGRR